MSKRKSYFAFDKNCFTHSYNFYGGGNCDFDSFINKITKKQFDIYKEQNYGHIEIFESENDCRKYAKDLLNIFINKKEAIKQSFLNTFSKEFCDYLFSQELELTENDLNYYKNNINEFDYLFKTRLFLKEDFDFNVSKCKLMIAPMLVYNNCNKIFDIKNNKTLSINLKVQINES